MHEGVRVRGLVVHAHISVGAQPAGSSMAGMTAQPEACSRLCTSPGQFVTDALQTSGHASGGC